MTIVSEYERVSDSPYITEVSTGYTASDGSIRRPAEINWHLIIVRNCGHTHALLAGPWSTSGMVIYEEGHELIWIRLKLGTFMPHMPTRSFLNSEIILPEASSKTFWLNGSAWQFPDYNNVETFIDRLVKQDVLACDPVVAATLQGQPPDLAPRTVRHRFLQTTGLTQNHIHQVQRAQRAAALLRKGVPILDTVHETGYFDQPHLTRALKLWIGYTPASIMPSCKLE